MESVTRTVYVGWDAREQDAYEVCNASLRKRSSVPLHVVPMKHKALRNEGLFRREWRVSPEGTMIDLHDGKPFSTEFSHSRFLVPHLHKEGWCLFVDCDFLFRADVEKLFKLADDRFAAMVVKHDFRPEASVKMDGCVQEPYQRKLWSSLVLWNCSHPKNANLTPYWVNHADGGWLHRFGWLDDEEIGSIPCQWNWIQGYEPEPLAVHFTDGVPSMPGYENTAYADEWRAYL